MADGNGHDKSGSLWPPHETTNFRIGGTDIAVPVLNLDILDRLGDKIRSLDADMSVLDYAKTVIEVVTDLLSESRPDLTAEVLRKHCSFLEARGLVGAWAELLRASGFGLGEAEAASPGTGTLTGSSPNSEPVESAAETPI